MQNFNYGNYMQGCGGYNYMQPQQPQKNEYAFVDGIEGAKAYNNIRPNSMMLLMDSQQPICYQKQVNAYGQTTMFKVFDLVEHQEQPTQKIDYVTKEEFNKEIADLKALLGKGE